MARTKASTPVQHHVRRAAVPSPVHAWLDPSSPAVHHVAKSLGSARRSQEFTLGTYVLCALLFIAGAAPWALPALFAAFFLLCMPWRVIDFCNKKYQFFMIDFCYFVSLSALLFLTFFPNQPQLEALVYALADGPLAGALVAWQCAWVLGSSDHTISVLVHLLPGLAIFAHRYYTPAAFRGWQGALAFAQHALRQGPASMLAAVAAAPPPAVARLAHPGLWLLPAPLLYYAAWQLLYFVVVQLCCRSFILSNAYETSYTVLARRAARTNNFWNRLVRRGSATRRCAMYAAVQLVYTLTCLMVFAPTYFSFRLALALQVAKLAFPLYYGSKHQCQKQPQRYFLHGVRLLDAALAREAAAAAAAAVAAAAAAASDDADGDGDDEREGGAGAADGLARIRPHKGKGCKT